jgi:hypothetical protein
VGLSHLWLDVFAGLLGRVLYLLSLSIEGTYHNINYSLLMEIVNLYLYTLISCGKSTRCLSTVPGRITRFPIR